MGLKSLFLDFLVAIALAIIGYGITRPPRDGDEG